MFDGIDILTKLIKKPNICPFVSWKIGFPGNFNGQSLGYDDSFTLDLKGE